MAGSRGVVAAGHELTAEAGAQLLREGGNAVDAAIAAVLASFVCEPLLTGFGAGGYLMVAPPGEDPVLLDFFVEAPGRDGPASCEVLPASVSFGDVVQVFHIGAASVGVPGTPAGLAHAAGRWARAPLDDLVAPAVRLAREGLALNAMQAYVVQILEPIVRSTPSVAALFAPGDRLLREGDRYRDPHLADTLERFAADGAEPFYRGDIAAAAAELVREHGGALSAADLEAYEPQEHEPVRVTYRGRPVLTTPPPSAGGVLIALALALLDREPGPPGPAELVAALETVNAQRDEAFLEGLAEPGFAERFLGAQLGATTHIAVQDADGWAASVTCTNGEGSGLIVPGTGVHLNNVMGEEDLNPFGFGRFPPGRRMPSMMAPTMVMADGAPDLVLGSAGSNRIRSTIVQVISAVLDRGLSATDAVQAPRLHVEGGVIYAEPGVALEALAGRELVEFSDRNLFFGGTQLVERDPATGELSGAGDPRRGGAVVRA
jgi:gamma-glutamyltranspeptidase / glutathione hydrolase